MNRRRFLAWLGGTAAGVAAASTLDVEKLLWTPGAKTIFLPPVPSATSLHAFVTPDWLTKEALRHFENRLTFAERMLTIENGSVRHVERVSWPGNHALDLRKGDIITIEGINAMNPLRRTPTSHRQQFVVMADMQVGETILQFHPGTDPHFIGREDIATKIRKVGA